MILYGSNVPDATLTTACDMANVTGGTEVSSVSTYNSTPNDFGEVYSQGNATIAGQTSLPAPTGNGWVYMPGAGTFTAGNWSAAITISYANFNAASTITVRFYQYSGGVYTAIGTITVTVNGATKQVYSFAATAMGALTFATNDLLYTDLWMKDPTDLSNDVATVYLSNSATQGVANDMQITTASFTPAAGGGSIAPPVSFWSDSFSKDERIYG